MKFIESIQEIFDRNIIQYSITIALGLLFLVLRSVVSEVIRKHSIRNQIAHSREVYVRKLVNFGTFALILTLIGGVWEISFKGLSVYFASIFTVVGVALFATWSILSNVTASVVLFFFFPYRIGDKIKVLDGDNSVEGTITDITLFYLKIETENHEIFSYPNNLAIQKPFRKS